MDGRVLMPGAAFQGSVQRWGPVVATVCAALGVIALFVVAAGSDPVAAAGVFLSSTLGEIDGILEATVRAIPLTLVGLGIVVAFRARMFNVGADGQLYVGAILAVAAVQAAPGLSGWLLVPVFLAGGIIGGGLYGGIAGWLRARYNANEIIVTIMLNYVAIQLLSWAIRGPMQESMNIFPRSDPIPDRIVFEPLIPGSQLHAGVLIAIAAAVASYIVLKHTKYGYQLQAVGGSRLAARFGGTNDALVIVMSLVVSGAFAGLAGAVEIAGIHQRLQDDFAPGIGVTGIAVALLAKLNPLAVPFTALLFGVLSVGSGALQREMGIPFPLVSVIEGVVILGFLVLSFFRARRAESAGMQAA